VTEADELYQNAKQKGRKHPDPLDPPRHRANQARGHGTWANDRPPIVGMVGRRSGHIRLRVCKRADRATLEALVVAHTRPDAIVTTDEWAPYQHLAASGRLHQTVCHAPGRRVWARDEHGDGVREVDNNIMEGIWTGCRNFLRLFRGISKWFLAGYVAVFECAHNLKWVRPTLLHAMMTLSPLNQHEPSFFVRLTFAYCSGFGRRTVVGVVRFAPPPTAHNQPLSPLTLHRLVVKGACFARLCMILSY
jgi:transposase